MSEAQDVEITTDRGMTAGILNAAPNARGGMIMVGGAGGGIHGPAGIYEPLAERLSAAGISALRLEYRYPDYLNECIYDVLAGLEALGRQTVDKIALLGWSFGGAVVITAGAMSAKVVGVATVASQSYGADASGLDHKSLLLIHGSGDAVLPDTCSHQLYEQAHEPKELVLYPADDHGISHHASEMLDKIYGWATSLMLAPIK